MFSFISLPKNGARRKCGGGGGGGGDDQNYDKKTALYISKFYSSFLYLVQHFSFISKFYSSSIYLVLALYISKFYSSSLYLVLAAGFSNKTSRYSCLVEGWVGKLVRHLIKTQTNIPTTLYGSQTMHLKYSQLQVFAEENYVLPVSY